MTVTKQQQLGWLVGFTDGCYVISQEEWQQERDKMQKQSAQDYSWYERGELPPVGTICKMIDDKNTWLECEIIAHKNSFCIGWISSRNAPFYTDDKSEFRPLHTEREKAIDAACDVICKNGVYDFERGVIEKLYDAGMLYNAEYHKVKP